MKLILQRHGVRHDLKAVVQAAIVLAVGKGVLPVGDVQQRRGILTVLARTVDLQLYAEEAGPRAVEDGAGLEIVVVDRTVLNVGATVAAIGVVVVVGIPALIKGDETAAAGASGIVAVIAVGAKGRGRRVPDARSGCCSRRRSLSCYPGSPGKAGGHGIQSDCQRYSRSGSRCE